MPLNIRPGETPDAIIFRTLAKAMLASHRRGERMRILSEVTRELDAGNVTPLCSVETVRQHESVAARWKSLLPLMLD